jgi:hypothetical protein
MTVIRWLASSVADVVGSTLVAAQILLAVMVGVQFDYLSGLAK